MTNARSRLAVVNGGLTFDFGGPQRPMRGRLQRLAPRTLTQPATRGARGGDEGGRTSNGWRRPSAHESDDRGLAAAIQFLLSCDAAHRTGALI